jgi:hypothetical protein
LGSLSMYNGAAVPATPARVALAINKTWKIIFE